MRSKGLRRTGMFDGVPGPIGRIYRICSLGAGRWRVTCPDARGSGTFSSIDGAFAYVRRDSCGIRATVEVLADAMYLVKHLPAVYTA